MGIPACYLFYNKVQSEPKISKTVHCFVALNWVVQNYKTAKSRGRGGNIGSPNLQFWDS